MVAAILHSLLLATRAHAIEVECIADSKYKRLYQIFDGDPAKFAAYLEVDTGTRRLPDPEACRSALVKGAIGERSDDRDRLLQFIVRNGGWLAAIYLDSGGGSVAAGQQLGWVVRAFRLKTYAVPPAEEVSFYEPDFGLPPAGPSQQAVAAAGKPARCWFKNSAPAERPATNTVSGIVRPDGFTATYEENIDRPGHDYRNFVPARSDPRLCQQQCVQESRCRAWTYVAPDRSPSRQPLCWLKNDVPAGMKGENVTSGLVIRPESFQPTYEVGTDRPGGDYRRFDLPIPDPRFCQRNCQQDQRCRAWTYERPADSALVALMSGWDGYRTGTAPLRPTSGCSSACTFLHVAGIDRHGISNFHRARLDFREMSDDAIRLLAGEPAVIAYYTYMDAGPEAVRTYQSTSTNDLMPVQVPRSPRYVADYLIAKCHADPEKFETIELQLAEDQRSLSILGLDLPMNHIVAGLASLRERRQRIEQCVAREEEKDRLEAFDRLCGKGCDVSKLATDFDADLGKAVAAK